jgi:hypothetical protein
VKIQNSLLLLVSLFIGIWQATPATPSPVLDANAEYQFGQSISFTADLNPATEITDVFVFWQTQAPESSFQGKADIIGTQAVYTHDLTRDPLPPFSRVTYWFGVTYPDGKIDRIEGNSFIYEDTRFDWNTITDTAPEGALDISWVNGDLGFAQQIIDTARSGMRQAHAILPDLPAEQDDPIQIYVYPSAKDVQEALQLTGQTWAAGHADPRLNIILVSIPQGAAARTEMERQIPHEIMHILLYQFVVENGGTYAYLPTWLTEGLASSTELAANPDYPVMIYDAWQADQLLPMASLCQVFPRDPSASLLAYAQSNALVRYIQENYGASGLEALIEEYADGKDCQQGSQDALELSLNSLESEWKSDTFGTIETPKDPTRAYSWLILLGALILIPILPAFLFKRKQPESTGK